MERSKVLEALSALANENRLELVYLLLPRGESGLSAGEIGRHLGLTSSRLSFHLAALEKAGLIRSRRVSRNVFYTLDRGGFVRTIGVLMRDCSTDAPDDRDGSRTGFLADNAPTAPGRGPER